MKLLNDILTGLDGDTVAVGRFLAICLMLAALPAPIFLAVYIAVTTHPTIEQWGAYLMQVGAFYTPCCGSAVALITLTNSTEPKGNDK